MKFLKLIFLNLMLTLGLTLIQNSVNAQLKVINNKVGINNVNPAYHLDVNGGIKANDFRTNEDYLKIVTNFGYTLIGPGNDYWSHFRTDRTAFWFNKRAEINGHLTAYSNNTYNCGSNNKRWKKGFFTTLYRVSEQTLSDKKTKENFRVIDSALDKVLKLNGKLYDYKPEVFMPKFFEKQADEELELSNVNSNYKASNEHKSEQINLAKLEAKAEIERKDHLGFIAQEVKEIVPEAVEYDDETGLYSMSYTALIPILVEAIKEQQKQIDALKRK